MDNVEVVQLEGEEDGDIDENDEIISDKEMINSIVDTIIELKERENICKKITVPDILNLIEYIRRRKTEKCLKK
jgi:hypothetical protein